MPTYKSKKLKKYQVLWLNLLWQWMQYYCRFVAFVDPLSSEEEGSLHPFSEYNREINTTEILSVINFFIHKSKSLEHIFAQNLSPSYVRVYQKTPFLSHIQCLWVYTTHKCAYFSEVFFEQMRAFSCCCHCVFAHVHQMICTVVCSSSFLLLWLSETKPNKTWLTWMSQAIQCTKCLQTASFYIFFLFKFKQFSSWLNCLCFLFR